ncbi:amino acid adenylation domain-containing protein [Kitasatospora sp. NPDC093806]|uniref:amino acid adenylation domain-containing protein n=1 Tax=Kitasatospora sp. NPDC093806 TaxID=3155075 RepID=UPI00342DDF9E
MTERVEVRRASAAAGAALAAAAERLGAPAPAVLTAVFAALAGRWTGGEQVSVRRDGGSPAVLDAVAGRTLAGLLDGAAGSGSALPVTLAADELPGLTLELTVEPTVDGGELRSAAGLDPALWGRVTAESFLRAFERLLTGLAEAPHRTVGELPLVGEEESAELTRTLALGRPAHRDALTATLDGLFRARAAATPDATAVHTATGGHSYAALDRWSDAIAGRLHAAGVRHRDRVAISAAPGAAAVAGLLGVLKTGACYVPVTPQTPAERARAVLADAEVRVLLTDDADGTAARAADGRAVVLLDAAPDAPGAPLPPPPSALPTDLAYVLFTSGSTGRPKGVMIEHRSVAHFVRSAIEDYRITPADRFLQRAALGFDVSVLEIFATLLGGAALVIAEEAERNDPARLTELVRRAGVTVADLPPAMLPLLDPAALPGLRAISMGGESTPGHLIGPWSAGRTLIHQYGPTEATVAVTQLICAGDWHRPPPIGRPLPGHQIVVLDDRLRLVPRGAVGELCVAGPGLARGYAGRPDLTAEKFVANPYPAGPDTDRLYRTGDLVRWLEDGALEFLGRVDRQLNVRGFRIEAGEVEAVLTGHPAVGQAVVTAARAASGARVLAAYTVAAPGERIDPAELTAHAERYLPGYMRPVVVVLDRLPLTANGKVDHRALPAPTVRAAAAVAPRDITEQIVASVWAGLLGTRDLGVHDDFFTLGGDSLLATQVASRLREAFEVPVPLRLLFEHRTVAELAAALGRAGTEQGAPVLEARESAPDEPRPLSFAQRRLWFLDQLTPGMTAYTIAEAHRLRGPVDPAVLETALRDVLERHEVLRTRFTTIGGEPYAVLDGAERFTLARTDLGDRPDPAAAARELAREEAGTPFDLERGPLLRARLVRLAEQDHVLLLTVHHSVFDGWSVGIMERDLGTAYRARLAGGRPDWAPLPVQYADFAAWQRDWLDDEVLTGQVRYWRDQLADAPSVLELPTDRPRPALPSYHGGVHRFRLPAHLVEPLRTLGEEHGATPFMVLLALFQVLLAKHTGGRDIVVGSPVFGRTRPEVEDLVGFFVNSLPLRTELSNDPTARELVEAVRTTALEAFSHQDLPFEQLVEELAPPRDLSRTPVIQVWFDLFASRGALSLPDTRVEAFDTGFVSTRFDLELHLEEHPSGALDGELVYATDLFEDAGVARLAEHLTRLVRAVGQDPDIRPLHVDVLTDAERGRLLTEWAAPVGPYEAGATVSERFERQAARTPDAPAAVSGTGSGSGSETVTYRELNARANRLAGLLREHGAGRETIVGLCLPQGITRAAAVLAILKAGAAYLPLDHGLPTDRLEFMVRDAGAAFVLTTSELVDRLPADVPALLVDRHADDLAGRPDTDPEPTGHVDDLIYVIYTSGTTGRPKGIAMTHRPLLNLLHWQLERSAVPGPTLQFSAINFDISFQELFSTWFAGGLVVLLDEDQRRDPEEMLRVMRAHGTRRLFCPPMVLQQLAETAADPLPPLAEITTAGEELRLTPEIHRLLAGLPGVEVDNQYGPTEAHVITAHRLTGSPQDWPTAVPVGRPVPNTQVYVLDDALQPVPVGVPGEVCVGGDCLARGYLGRPGLTADRFVPDPYGARHGARLYRTGDQARWRPDGTLEFLGRIDHQVKIRGYRIEPGEIETVLRRHPGVADAAVVPVEVGGHRHLAGYLVPRAEEPGRDELRAHLRSVLPEHMVPGYLVFLPELPLTRVGKLDRKALPDPVAEGTSPTGEQAPGNLQEEIIADIWAEALGLPGIGVESDFFELGGHSLLATQVVSKVRAAFEVELPLRTLFENRTVAELARAVEEAVIADIAAMSDTEVTAAVHGAEPQTGTRSHR